MPNQFIAATLAMLAAAQPLWAEELCIGGPRDQWLTEAEVGERLTELGYGEFVLVIEDGCLEAKLVHEGKRIEIYLEPITGEIVRVREG